MTFRILQSQHWQPLLPITGCSPRCILSLMLVQPHSRGDQEWLCTANSHAGGGGIFLRDLFPLPGSLGDRLKFVPAPLQGWRRGEKQAVTLASLTRKKIFIKMKLGTVYMVKAKHGAKYLQNLAFLYTVTKYCAGFGWFFFFTSHLPWKTPSAKHHLLRFTALQSKLVHGPCETKCPLGVGAAWNEAQANGH